MEKFTSPELRLKPGRSGLPAQCSLCTDTTVDAVRRKVQAEGSVRGPPQPVTSRQQADQERPGGCAGLHLSQVTGHVAGGTRRRSPAGLRLGLGACPVRPVDSGPRVPPFVSPPSGLGKGSEFSPPRPPPALAACSQRCSRCSASVEPSASSQSK